MGSAGDAKVQAHGEHLPRGDTRGATQQGLVQGFQEQGCGWVPVGVERSRLLSAFAAGWSVSASAVKDPGSREG